MKLLETRVDVDGSLSEVWDVLMDFRAYGDWNPMVTKIEGEISPGSPLKVTIAMTNGRRMSFRPYVVEHERGVRFAWLGKVFVRGIFDGLHRFEVEPRPGGATFVHSEEFRGLVPVLLPKLLADTHASLNAMNEALVREVARRRSARADKVMHEQQASPLSATR